MIDRRARAYGVALIEAALQKIATSALTSTPAPLEPPVLTPQLAVPQERKLSPSASAAVPRVVSTPT